MPGYYGMSVLPPHSKTAKAPTIQHFRSSITRLLHWLFTLRAALSDDDAKLASGGLPDPSGWAFPFPLSSFREFPLSLPLSQGFAWRDLLLLLLSPPPLTISPIADWARIRLPKPGGGDKSYLGS